MNGREAVISLHLSEAVADYLLTCRSEGRSPRTVRWYDDKLRTFLAWRGDVALAALQTSDVRRFVAYLQEEHQPHATRTRNRRRNRPERLAPQTVKGYVQVVKGFCSWLEREGVSAVNPARRIRLPTVPKRVEPTLDAGAARRLLDGPDRRTWQGKRDAALLCLLMDVGLRLSELVAIDVERLDLGARTLVVRGKGAKERQVSWGDSTHATLVRWLHAHGASTSGPLFVSRLGGRLSAQEVYKLVRRYGRLAGVPALHPHALRHTFAVSYLRNGGDLFTLQKLLGHASLTMVRHYADLADADVLSAHARYSPLDALAPRRTAARPPAAAG